MATVNDSILDLDVRHQVGLTRLATGIVRKIIALLNRTDADIVFKLRARGIADGTFTTARLEKLLEAIRVINRNAYRLVEQRLAGDLSDLAKYEVDFQAALLQKVVPVNLDIVTPAREQLVAAVMARPFQGKLLSEWVAGMEAGRFSRLRDAIRMGVVEGSTTDQLVRTIAGTASNQYQDGILDISRRSAEAVVRTSVNHVANFARSLLFQENDTVIDAVQWVSVLDRRTSPICRSRDGKIYPVDSGPRPPAHINCRSHVVPVVTSWQDLGIDASELPPGTRASMDGQVADTITYNEWLKAQSASVQDEVLGPTRGALFRNGGLSVDNFVDRTGRQYTLDELAARESDAFSSAGVE